jgi:hypothetical protein
MESYCSALAEHKTHYRSQEINAEIVKREIRTGLAPNARGGMVHQKASAVAIRKLKESSAGKFGNYEGTIAWK